MPLRMRIHDREPIGAALRRFKKLLERSGLTKEFRKRKYYEKPSEARRGVAPRCGSRAPSARANSKRRRERIAEAADAIVASSSCFAPTPPF